MLIALVIVSILFILQTLYICFYKKQIQDISNQLTFITAHHSFKFIQTQIKPNEIAELIKQCNQLLEEQRVLNQEFKKKSEEINITIASLSHDIRTPLTSLDGYLQLALRTDSEKEKAKYVSRAQTKIKQIITLVDELFLYSKVQNSRYQLELELVNASDLLQKRFFSFLDELTEKNTNLTSTYLIRPSILLEMKLH
ncbi:sensory transduction protein kinase [Bacillus sp. JCM 19046]|nr:sensory transduction protein kinase [Bacillus sp. JCM 19046]